MSVSVAPDRLSERRDESEPSSSSAAALAPLAALPRLHELRASLAPSLGEAAVPVLLRFPALGRLRVDGSIPASALARLAAQRPQWFTAER